MAWAALGPEESLDYPVFGYRMQVGDRLNIDFYYQPQLTREVVVRPDGKIAMPLAGEIQAAGLTPRELEERLASTRCCATPGRRFARCSNPTATD